MIASCLCDGFPSLSIWGIFRCVVRLCVSTFSLLQLLFFFFFFFQGSGGGGGGECILSPVLWFVGFALLFWSFGFFHVFLRGLVVACCAGMVLLVSIVDSPAVSPWRSLSLTLLSWGG